MYDPDVLVCIFYHILAKTPEYGNIHLASILKMEIDTMSSSSDSLPRTTKTNQIVQESFANPDRIIIVLRSFLLLLANIEEEIGEKERDAYNASGASMSQSSSSAVLVEGKLTLSQPSFPNFKPTGAKTTLERLQEIKNPDKTSFVVSEPKEFTFPITTISQVLYAKIGSSLRETLGQINQNVGHIISRYFAALGHTYFFEVNFNAAEANETLITDAIENLGSLGIGIPSITAQGVFSDMMDTGINDRTRVDLLRVAIDSIPRFSPTGITPTRLIEMLSYFLINADEIIQHAAAAALSRISQIKGHHGGYTWEINTGESLPAAICRISTHTVISVLLTRYSDIWLSHKVMTTKSLTRFANIYLEALRLWLVDVRSHEIVSKAVVSQSEVDETIQSIETRGLLFLLQQEPQMRKIADQVFNLAVEFQKLLNSRQDELNKKMVDLTDVSLLRMASFHGSRRSILPRMGSRKSSKNKRAADVFRELEHELVSKHFYDPQHAYDQSTLQTDRQKQALLSRGRPLLHVATSMETADLAIWNRCLPDLIKSLSQEGNESFFSHSTSEVWILIRELYPLVTSISESNSSARSESNPNNIRLPSKPLISTLVVHNKEALIDQWRNYIVFLCASNNVALDTSSARLMSTSSHG